jgi:hypothetical protein
MSVIKEVQNALATNQQSADAMRQLKEHQEIFERMVEQGAVKRQGYTVVRPMGLSRKEAAAVSRRV